MSSGTARSARIRTARIRRALALTVGLAVAAVGLVAASPASAIPACPGTPPGVPISTFPQNGPLSTYLYPVTDPAGTYTTGWATDSGGMFEFVQGTSVPGGDYLQAVDPNYGSLAGWFGFSVVLIAGNDQAQPNALCGTRDLATATDYSGVPGLFRGLTLTTQTNYQSADTLRHVWTLTNNSGSAITGFPLVIPSTPWDNTNTVTLAQTSWGATFDDGLNLNDPVVTHLWGGPDVDVQTGPALGVVPLASSGPAARSTEPDWLAARSSMPDAALAGVPGTILNWGAGAVAADVTIGNGVSVGYDLPTIAAGQSVSIVEFAHVQYVAYGSWIDDELADAVAGNTYADSLTGPPGETWTYSLASGTLPVGLVLNPDGTVTGATFGTPANYSFAVDAVGSLGGAATTTVHLAVVSPFWVDFDLPNGRVGNSYADQVTGPGPGSTYSVTTGALPPGLALTGATGAISGTPTTAGAFPFTLTALDSNGRTSTHAFTVTIDTQPVGVQWTDVDLGALYLGVPADSAVAASGGVTGYTLVGGSWPAGVTIDTAGHVSGTPTGTGAYAFTMRATNANGFTDQPFAGGVQGATLTLEPGFTEGTSIADATATAEAAGLQVGSTWTMTLHSSPIVIGTGVVGPSSVFSALVQLPASTPPGQHSLVLAGVAGSGAAISSTVWFTLDANGIITAVSLTGPTPPLPAAGAPLASTGSEPWANLPLAAVLLGLGLALVLGQRRRVRPRLV